MENFQDFDWRYLWKKHLIQLNQIFDQNQDFKTKLMRFSDQRKESQILYKIYRRQTLPLTTISIFWLLLKIETIRTSDKKMSQGRMVSKSQKVEIPKMKIKVPHFDNSYLIKGYGKTLIGRCLNPRAQDTNSLIHMMPRIWGMEGRIAGGDLGMGRFQFDFDSEDDITAVLAKEPFHFDNWMVSLVRWEPVVDELYPSAITFWVIIMELPLQYWAEPTFTSIGGALGIVREVDLDYGRVKVTMDGFKPLLFESSVEFSNGEEISINLRYERLFGFCKKCNSLCHDHFRCPESVGDERNERKTASDYNRNIKDNDMESRDDRRNLSYKGATLQDSAPGQNRRGNEVYSRTHMDRRMEEDTKERSYKYNRQEDPRDLKSTRGIRRNLNTNSRHNNTRSNHSRNMVWKRSSHDRREQGTQTETVLENQMVDIVVSKENGDSKQAAGNNMGLMDQITNTEVSKSARKKLFGDGKNTIKEFEAGEKIGTIEEAEMQHVKPLGKSLGDGEMDNLVLTLRKGIELETIMEDGNFIAGDDAKEEDRVGMVQSEIDLHGKTNALVKQGSEDHGVRKKFIKSNFILRGASSKKRNAQILASPRKKILSSKSVRQDGTQSGKVKVVMETKSAPPPVNPLSN